MIFNSIDFAIFLPIVFIIYWLVNKNLKLQNIVILIASYIFYGWWDWKFLLLIIFSSTLDYTIGIALSKNKNEKIRKLLLFTSITINLGFLGFFKYYNFFLDNFVDAFSVFGSRLEVDKLNIILPVGISFYTFQTLSYSIDVYKNKLKPTNDIISFFTFVSFFPQLVAGPIERASNLLPQFYVKRIFNYNKAIDGLRQILWGLFKKVVIADNCAELANEIFNNYNDYNGITLIFGAIFFSFQIYGDFSGYSDIAIGTSRLFGFNLLQNFSYPYLSRDISEFWRKWHISLNTWFKDYLYIPLGGSKGGNFMKIRNVSIIFLVSGFWHGANWTFITWGALNALFFLPLILSGNNRNNLDIIAEDKKYPSIREVIQVIKTFIITTFAWIFFRSDNVMMAYNYINKIFSRSIFNFPNFNDKYLVLEVLTMIMLQIIIEWHGRKNNHPFEYLNEKIQTKIFRWGLYIIIAIIILTFTGNQQEFIYFQF